MRIKNIENCAICGCQLHRQGDYAKPTIKGRSHATKHHFIAERFFGRSTNRKGEKREAIFEKCPWDAEGKTIVFCYECHEELIHNPVFLRADIEQFSSIVESRGLMEEHKTEDRGKIAGRIKLLHEIISKGIQAVGNEK